MTAALDTAAFADFDAHRADDFDAWDWAHATAEESTAEESTAAEWAALEEDAPATSTAAADIDFTVLF
jgi:hypothetical protein